MRVNSMDVFKKNVQIVGSIMRRKPCALARVLYRFCEAYVSSQPRLRFMDIALDYACNFSCTHCSAETLKKKGVKTLSLPEYKEIAAQAKAAGVLLFHFTGGEPLVRRDFFDVMSVFYPRDSLISVQTNGWYVTESFCREFRDRGGDIVCVSIDSVDADIHDSFRNQPGSHARAVQAINYARAAGLQTFISYTLTHQNLNSDDFYNMIMFADRLHSTLSLNLAVPAGKWAGLTEYLLTPKDRRFLNDIMRRYPHVRTDHESNWKVRGCPGFIEKCYLSPYGDVLPCPFIQISFGNIRETSLAEIRRRALAYKYMRTYHPVCVAAEDRRFISSAGCYSEACGSLPILYTDSPFFMSEGKRGKDGPEKD